MSGTSLFRGRDIEGPSVARDGHLLIPSLLSHAQPAGLYITDPARRAVNHDWRERSDRTIKKKKSNRRERSDRTDQEGER